MENWFSCGKSPVAKRPVIRPVAVSTAFTTLAVVADTIRSVPRWYLANVSASSRSTVPSQLLPTSMIGRSAGACCVQ